MYLPCLSRGELSGSRYWARACSRSAGGSCAQAQADGEQGIPKGSSWKAVSGTGTGFIVGQAYEGGVYGYENKQDFGPHLELKIPNDAESRRAADVALAAYRALGCRDIGRVDLRSDMRSEPHFLEVNPISGLTPGFSDLPMLADMSGRSYDWLIRRIVAEACGRYGLTVPKPTGAVAAA